MTRTSPPTATADINPPAAVQQGGTASTSWHPALFAGATLISIALPAAAALFFTTGHPTQARTTLVLLSTLLAASSTLPTIRGTLRRDIKPRLITWGTWCLLTAMAGAASATTRDYPSAAFCLIGTAATGAVLVTAWRFGERDFATLDAVCLALVALGVILWLTLDQPGMAVVASCLVDFIGLVPTLVHTWHHPEEESTTTYALIACAGVCAAVAAWGQWTITAQAYPVYVAVSMGATAALTLRTRRTGSAAASRT
jgi:hypothetical protein